MAIYCPVGHKKTKPIKANSEPDGAFLQGIAQAIVFQTYPFPSQWK
jgi:hypothetical protein